MAAIEKICEYSGEYPGPLMYGYKRNLIQIMPEYKKLFEKREHTLYVSKEIELYERFPGLKGVYGSLFKDSFEKRNNKYYSWKPWRRDWERFKRILVVKQWNYCLYVPSLPGDVKGYYYNYSCSLGTVKRKIKRMLKTKKLNVVYVETNKLLWELSRETSTCKI